MNFLAHLHLGGPLPEQLLGSLYGDFIKGPLEGRFSPALEQAIRLHRAIDTYTDSHPIVLAALARFPAQRRRFAGIILDVFFDHCLARQWAAYHPQPLGQFTAQVYGVLRRTPDLPGRLATIAPLMIENDWLGSYQDFEVLGRVLLGISRRLSRPEGLQGAMPELRALYPYLMEDFQRFYPELQRFAAERGGAEHLLLAGRL
ncbi:ACP phosphodiesterase [Pseudomonas sp. RIT-PI-S]|uniref:acyl carrier protein phosphodiesterase n=1 Tax=Pseudomonas sp. RIT-PI-S TaxID=3035295 RepID=UPI0021DA9E9B|nr:ACP phosphodiesterase [Pseudomonas sp. RIT-PI-S]